jgi:hypothetical protein
MTRKFSAVNAKPDFHVEVVPSPVSLSPATPAVPFRFGPGAAGQTTAKPCCSGYDSNVLSAGRGGNRGWA